MFGMDTGGSSLLSPPDFLLLGFAPSKLNNANDRLFSNSMLLEPLSISDNTLNFGLPKFQVKPSDY